MPKTALITGIRGQDGYHLAELLLSKGYKVVGTTSKESADRVSAMAIDGWEVPVIQMRLSNANEVADVLKQWMPIELYNLSARASGAGLYDDPISMAESTGFSVACVLEAVRMTDSKIRVFQASSSEMFGNSSQSPQTELTSFHPRSPYAAAKVYGHNLIGIYRNAFKMHCCSGILYNHEGPRRRLEFVTRKITSTAARIKMGFSDKLVLGSLDSQRDWGYVGDFVNAMWLILQASIPDDYVIATGRVHSVGELCECAFGYLGLNYRDYVVQDPSLVRPFEGTLRVGDPSKAYNVLGWRQTVDFRQLIEMMVEADLKMLKAASR